MRSSTILLFLSSVLAIVGAKTFTKCGLASELRRLGVAKSDIHNWVCMAEHESGFRTTAVHKNTDSHSSTDYGIFQINSYWNCDDGYGTSKNGCNHSCSDFTDSDLTDDVACIKLNLRWHHGDFSTVSYGYKDHCQGVTDSYLKGCLF